MIDVKELIATHSLEELNRLADDYFKSFSPDDVTVKPFRIPGIIHLLIEVSHLIHGLGIRPGDGVLDFGCGGGWTSRILHACRCDVIGVDVSETALALARSTSERWRQAGLFGADNEARLQFIHFDGVRMEVANSSVDQIFVLDAFHHVSDQASVLREFARVLKPGGSAGFCEPGPTHS